MNQAPAVLFALVSIPAFAWGVLDADGDGMFDGWELQYGFHVDDDGTLHPDEAPGADPDGDGASNLRESIAGTDPRNPQSHLRLSMAVDSASGDCLLVFPTVADKSYRIERSFTLAAGDWVPFIPDFFGDGQEQRVPVVGDDGGGSSSVTGGNLASAIPSKVATLSGSMFFRLVCLGNPDADNDGLPDAWERRYFSILFYTGSDDPDHDGWSNAAELQNGTDPNDSFNGRTPSIQIVIGNLQEAMPDSILPQPLLVQVLDAAGHSIAGVPVTFARSTGDYCLVLGSPNRSDVLFPPERTTDSDGLAQVWLLTPPVVEATMTIVATAGVGRVSARVTFVETTQTLPPPNAPSDILLSSDTQGRDVIEWQDNSEDEDSFIVERQAPNGTWEIVAILPPGTNTFTVPR